MELRHPADMRSPTLCYRLKQRVNHWEHATCGFWLGFLQRETYEITGLSFLQSILFYNFAFEMNMRNVEFKKSRLDVTYIYINIQLTKLNGTITNMQSTNNTSYHDINHSSYACCDVAVS